MTSDVKMQNLMSDVTDAILSGESVDAVRTRYGVARHESDELTDLVMNLNRAMVQVEPSLQFKRRLKADLMEQNVSVFWRLRRMPTRVRFAAVAAVVGGFALILQRLFIGEPKTTEDNALQEKF